MIKSQSGIFIQEFVWGEVQAYHEIGEFLIVEYKEKETNEICFHPYVNGEDTNRSYETLDQALIGCITRKYEGSNNQYADSYIFKMLNII